MTNLASIVHQSVRRYQRLEHHDPTVVLRTLQQKTGHLRNGNVRVVTPANQTYVKTPTLQLDN